MNKKVIGIATVIVAVVALTGCEQIAQTTTTQPQVINQPHNSTPNYGIIKDIILIKKLCQNKKQTFIHYQRK